MWEIIYIFMEILLIIRQMKICLVYLLWVSTHHTHPHTQLLANWWKGVMRMSLGLILFLEFIIKKYKEKIPELELLELFLNS